MLASVLQKGTTPSMSGRRGQLGMIQMLHVARNGPTGPVGRCSLIAVDRKWLAEGQTGAIEPSRILALAQHQPAVL